MPKSNLPKAKGATKLSGDSLTSFPSKPYMRAQSQTSTPATAAWSTTDDELLLRSKSAGKKWVEISPLFYGKTSNACRKRHARLVTHTQVEWDEFKERDLAVEFVNAKVAFFKVIAANMKLEWRQVEKKCLELGFKTLLEKGKRLPLPLPPFVSPGRGPETGDEQDQQDMSKTDPELSTSMGPDLMIPLYKELSDGDVDITGVGLSRSQVKPTQGNTELEAVKCRDVEEGTM